MLTAVSMSAIATNGVVPGNVGWLPAISNALITIFDTSFFSTLARTVHDVAIQKQ